MNQDSPARGPTVLMVTGEYPPVPGGVGDYTALLSTHLAHHGARVRVLTRGREDTRDRRDEPQGIPVLRVARGWGLPSWFRVASAAAECGAGVIHIQYQAAAYAMSPAVNLLPAYLRARLRRVKVVTTFHDLRVPYLFPKAGPIRQAAVRALDVLSHGSVVTNRADLEELGGESVSRFGRQPRRWIIPLGSNIDNAPPLGYDRSAWRRRLGVAEDGFLLSYFGFMNDSKGVEWLVQAMGSLLARGLELTLVMVGGESGETDPTNRAFSRQVLERIQRQRLGDRVLWTGMMSPEQVSASLLSSDLCVLPFRDGASFRRGSLLAALAHGLPVLTTLPERPEPLLVSGENVMMVKRDSPDDLAGAIEGLWRDPECRSRLSAGALALARRFRWPDIAVHHLEMYRMLLASKP